MKPIPLKDIIERIYFINDETMTFLNTDTGEFEYVKNYPTDDYCEKWESEKYISLPDEYDIHKYEIMKSFCYTVESDESMDRLLSALRGKGAFRRFKDLVYNLGLNDVWFSYQHNAYRDIAINWCNNHNIEFTDK